MTRVNLEELLNPGLGMKTTEEKVKMVNPFQDICLQSYLFDSIIYYV